MKNRKTCQKGFTLMELLVVIVIISVLMAVALPQYQRAVEKARFVEAETLLNSLVKAFSTYWLATGRVLVKSDDWPELNITMPFKEHNVSGGLIHGYRHNHFIYGQDSDTIDGRKEVALFACKDGKTLTYCIDYKFFDDGDPAIFWRECNSYNPEGAQTCRTLCGEDSCKY